MDEFDGLDAFADRVRDAYTEVPLPELAERHLSAMIAAPVGVPAARARRRLRRRVAQLAVVGVGGALLSSGLAYAGVPAVPNPVQAVVEAASNPRKPLPSQAPDHAREHKDRVNAYNEALEGWHACVKEAQAELGEDAEGFNKEAKVEACGEKPNPHDFGMTGPPENPSEHGQQTAEDAKAKSHDGTPDEVDHPTKDDHPGGKPEDVPPTDVPGGPPSG